MKKLILTIVVFFSIAQANSQTMKNFETDTLLTNEGKEIRITFIRHASLLIEYDDYTIHIDPVSEYADYTSFPKADLVLITHEHHDHFDLKAIAAIKKNGTHIITNGNVGKSLKGSNIMKVGESVDLKSGISVTTTPAYNITTGHTQFHPKGRDLGFILSLGGTRIYISGDTEDIPELKNLENIDVAFLPVNQPYTMTIEQASNAALIVKPKILYPYHYSDTEISLLAAKLADSGIEVRIREMQ